ncbi:MAG: class I mannose-6-phosphate isomerase [Ruminococcus sp.]|nr:class I mannose-6-phosphate isomerase [Ruminococcus sp.]
MRPFLLKPVIKDYIWGGTRLRERFGKVSDAERLAESWELSCHPDGESIIADGEFKGMTLSEFIRQHPEAVGKDFRSGDRFPVLVKLIDAKDDLSLQVHPDDAYAEKYEHDSGKTEMWYVIEADEGAEIIYGFKKKLSDIELRRAVTENRVMDAVRRVPVKAGDTFFIKSGTIHAIGKGILLAEIQQSSNVTYRVYDYNRLGIDGKPRELHIEKALEVMDTEPSEVYPTPETERTHGLKLQHLADCPYFHVMKLDIYDSLNDVGRSCFVHVLVIDGSGEVEYDGGKIDITKGSSVFFPCGTENCRITGKCSVIMTTA